MTFSHAHIHTHMHTHTHEHKAHTCMHSYKHAHTCTRRQAFSHTLTHSPALMASHCKCWDKGSLQSLAFLLLQAAPHSGHGGCSSGPLNGLLLARRLLGAPLTAWPAPRSSPGPWAPDNSPSSLALSACFFSCKSAAQPPAKGSPSHPGWLRGERWLCQWMGTPRSPADPAEVSVGASSAPQLLFHGPLRPMGQRGLQTRAAGGPRVGSWSPCSDSQRCVVQAGCFTLLLVPEGPGQACATSWPRGSCWTPVLQSPVRASAPPPVTMREATAPVPGHLQADGERGGPLGKPSTEIARPMLQAESPLSGTVGARGGHSPPALSTGYCQGKPTCPVELSPAPPSSVAASEGDGFWQESAWSAQGAAAPTGWGRRCGPGGTCRRAASLA